MNGNPGETHPVLVVASRNLKKSLEIQDLLAPRGILVVSVGKFEGVPEVIEDGTTFGENAAKKAVQTALHLGMWALGEDSGLCADALGGAPGIFSARFSGNDATDDSNNAKLIRELQGIPDECRGAKYVCHLAIADPQGAVRLSCEATCRGRITHEPRGTHGFGYDPYFLIREYHRTFGELSPIVKQHLSHRARAFARVMGELATLMSLGRTPRL